MEAASPSLSTKRIWHSHLSWLHYALLYKVEDVIPICFKLGSASPSILYYTMLYYTINKLWSPLFTKWRQHVNLIWEGFDFPTALHYTILFSTRVAVASHTFQESGEDIPSQYTVLYFVVPFIGGGGFNISFEEVGQASPPRCSVHVLLYKGGGGIPMSLQEVA